MVRLMRKVRGSWQLPQVGQLVMSLRVLPRWWPQWLWHVGLVHPSSSRRHMPKQEVTVGELVLRWRETTVVLARFRLLR